MDKSAVKHNMLKFSVERRHIDAIWSVHYDLLYICHHVEISQEIETSIWCILHSNKHRKRWTRNLPCNNTLIPLSCLFHKTNLVTYLTCKVLGYITYAISIREWRHNLQRAPNVRKDLCLTYGSSRLQRCQPYTPAVITPPTLDTPATYFSWMLSRLQCHTAAGRIPSVIEPATCGL